MHKIFSHSSKFLFVLAAAVLVLTGATAYSVTKSSPAKPAASLTDEEQFVAVAQKAVPAVVNIVATKDTPVGRNIISRGTGFVVEANGLILTNRHVVSQTDVDYRVYFPDGRRYTATVVGRDPMQDLALVKINGDKLPALALGNSDVVNIGQTAIAIGNSLGRYPSTVTRGIISGIGRSITAGDDLTGKTESLDDVIQTDAEINLGNSGGPLLNSKGEVVGINTAIEQGGRGVGFALPINEGKKIIESYKKTGRIIRPYLGIRYTTVTADLKDEKKLAYDYGALVDAGEAKNGPAVLVGGPADKAGIKAGDIILSVNDRLIRGSTTLYKTIQQFQPGNTVSLKVYRGTELLTVRVTLEEVPGS